MYLQLSKRKVVPLLWAPLKSIHSVYTNLDNLQVVLTDFDNSTN